MLRECGEGRYTLLGDAYVHGVMGGEAMKEGGGEVVQFKLC